MGAPGSWWMTDRALADFRDMWADGVATAEMALRLGVSKNSIVSKRRQMGLPERGSPIFRGTKHDPQPAPKVKRPPLASARPEWAPLPLHPLPPPKPVVAAPPPRPVARPVERRAGRVEPCCWVTRMGGKGKLATYCDDPGLPGRPYCGEHFKLAHVKARDRKTGGEPAHGAAMGGD